jgi:hypothetical protein
MSRDFDINSPGDIFDSSDAIERFEELQAEHDLLQEAIDEAAEAVDEAKGEVEDAERGEGSMVDPIAAEAALGLAEANLKEAETAMEIWTDYEEFAALKSFVDEASGYGETFIADSHFEDYAQELAEDIGAVKRNAEWPYTCIDWKQAAEELKADYTSYEINGSTYWARS